MKVFLVNQFALRPIDSGSLRHYFLGRFLVGKGIHVSIVLSDVHYNTRKKLKWSKLAEKYSDVEFQFLSAPAYGGNLSRLWNHLIFSFKLFVHLLKQKINKEDVIIGSSPQPFCTFVAMLVAKIKGCSFIYEVRDLWPQTLIDLGGLSESHPLVKIMFCIERSLCKHSSRIIVLMPAADQYFIQKHKVSSEKIMVIPQGIEIFDLPVEEKQSEQPLDVVYAGTLGSANRIEFLIDIAAELQKRNFNIHLSVYGNGSERTQLQKRVDDLKLKNFTLICAIPRNQILKRLSGADAAIVLAHETPLYKFGISFNKIFDYFLAKCPVIFIGRVTKNPVSESDAGVVIESSNVSLVAEQIISFLSQDSQTLRNFGQNGFTYLNRVHNINVTGENLLNVVKSVSRLKHERNKNG